MSDKCSSCVEYGTPEWENSWDMEGCLGGDWYGFCSVEDCYGLCEYEGACGCKCHQDGRH